MAISKPAISGTAAAGSEPLPAATILARGLAGRCPRCGKGPLFAGFLAVAAQCTACGLSFAGHDSGDGPAVFGIFILGFGIVGLAGVVEYLYAPPLWLHAVLWLPLTLGSTVLLLRPLKGLLIGAQYRFRAVDEPEQPGAT